jgi:hypothetical protein
VIGTAYATNGYECGNFIGSNLEIVPPIEFRSRIEKFSASIRAL